MFTKKIGIDLGSSSVRAYLRGEGVVVDEASAVALERKSGRVLAVGREAAELDGRAPGHVEVVRPIRAGTIADLTACERMLEHLIQRLHGRQRWFKPEVVFCVPSAASGVERRAMARAAITAGARQAWLIESPLVAAMGAGLSVVEPPAHLICDLGGGTVEVALVSRSSLVVAHTEPLGGARLDAAIVAYVRRRHGLEIGERTAEEVKRTAGAAEPLDRPLLATVAGKDVVGGRPRTATVVSDEVAEALQEPLAELTAAIRRGLEQVPEAYAAEVEHGGMLLTGGGALLRGLGRYLARQLHLPVRVAPDPRTCAVRGTGRALGELEVVQRRQVYLMS
ncbi:MAG TPA: rod shape-determining protein [Candidatus Dormibacteraeota bacterium]|nr:rod shape-determining protein [Candidatus Dormibacteraeota bacterium]